MWKPASNNCLSMGPNQKMFIKVYKIVYLLWTDKSISLISVNLSLNSDGRCSITEKNKNIKMNNKNQTRSMLHMLDITSCYIPNSMPYFNFPSGSRAVSIKGTLCLFYWLNYLTIFRENIWEIISPSKIKVIITYSQDSLQGTTWLISFWITK